MKKVVVSFAMLISAFTNARGQNVIRPGLVYSIEIRGTGDSETANIAQDASGNAYVAATVYSKDKSCDVSVSKVSPSGSVLHTFVFGGSGCDRPNAIAVDGK